MGVPPNIHTYNSYINACCKAGDMQRAEKVIEEMADVGLKPNVNVKTYTTLIKGWARASLPDRALKCFEEMKLAGLKPDEAAYHCLVTSLLSRATVMEGSTYTRILSVCREMFDNDLTADLCIQRIFSPGWNSLEVLGEASDSLSTGDSDYCSDTDFSDEEDQDADDNRQNLECVFIIPHCTPCYFSLSCAEVDPTRSVVWGLSKSRVWNLIVQ